MAGTMPVQVSYIGWPARSCYSHLLSYSVKVYTSRMRNARAASVTAVAQLQVSTSILRCRRIVLTVLWVMCRVKCGQSCKR